MLRNNAQNKLKERDTMFFIYLFLFETKEVFFKKKKKKGNKEREQSLKALTSRIAIVTYIFIYLYFIQLDTYRKICFILLS